MIAGQKIQIESWRTARRWGRLIAVGLPVALLVAPAAALAQARVESRTEQLEILRRDKTARLWPESQNQIVNIANKMTERGMFARRAFSERGKFSESWGGSNGFQPAIFGGTRSGNGFSYGMGYQRRDIWQDRFAFRVTGRATAHKGYAFDVAAEAPRALGTDGFIRFNSKYENSPRMGYYGPGPNSDKANRTGYRLEDTSVQFSVGYRFTRPLSVAGDVGGYFVNTGPGRHGDIPSIDEVFTEAQAPGINGQTNYFRWGATAEYDSRDSSFRPTKGGNYTGRFAHYSDRSLRQNGFIRLTGGAEKYLPYYNGGRVVAMRIEGQMAFVDQKNGQRVPFYLQPSLGGSNRLRGFENYRFTDATSVVATVEHRWYVSNFLDLAVFGETGKVAPLNGDLNFNDLKWSGGLSTRIHLFDSVFMRWDHAFSVEGYRMIFSFSDLFGREERW